LSQRLLLVALWRIGRQRHAGANHLPTLDTLGLVKRVCAEPLGAPRPPEEHWEDIVGQVARVLASDSRCLVHCADGFWATGTALACFLVIHGLDEEVKAEKPGQPRMTAGEAQIARVQRSFCGSAAVSKSAQLIPASSARVVPQPGDGNCLFHSLTHGLGQGTAATLRADICSFMEKHPDLSIAGTSLAEWIHMVAGSPLMQYAKKMAKGGQWGGAPEIACCAHMCGVNVHVYERQRGSFELTVPFDVGGARTVNVLYVGGVHYDALVL